MRIKLFATKLNFVLILLLTSCAYFFDIQPDTSWTKITQRWLSGDPCKSPCWEGITPGKTSPDEAKNLLLLSNIARNIRKSEYPESNDGLIAWSWNSKKNYAEVSYKLNKQPLVVSGIYLTEVPTFTLQEVISAFGNPDYVFGYVKGPPDYNAPRRHTIYITFDKYGIEIFTESWEIPPDIAPNLRFDTILLFDPSRKKSATRTLTDVPWHGYSTFKSYCKEVVNGKPVDCLFLK